MLPSWKPSSSNRKRRPRRRRLASRKSRRNCKKSTSRRLALNARGEFETGQQRGTIGSMSVPTKNGVASDRPAFAVTLGLLPPYTMDDVKRAYRDKVKDAHPDRGGSREIFDRIQRAFEEAGEYLKFRSDRR